jgi:hypothetical protein
MIDLKDHSRSNKQPNSIQIGVGENIKSKPLASQDSTGSDRMAGAGARGASHLGLG